MDFSEVEKAPGVIKVITHKDVKGDNHTTFPIGLRWAVGDGRERPIFCDKKVFRIGDVVALVAATTRRAAREAAKLAKVEYEELPAYLDLLDSVKEDAVQIHPGIPNQFIKRPFYFGEDTRSVFPQAAYVVEYSVRTPDQAHMPIEPDTLQAYVDEDGTVVIMMKTHTVYMPIGFISQGIGVPKDKIRIIENPSGGSFGYAFSPCAPAMVATATMALGGRPVSLTLSYAEHQKFTGKRPQSYANVKLGCDENGKLMAVELDMLNSSGTYSEGIAGTAQIPGKYLMTPYTIHNGRALARVAYTNTPHVVAYRCPAAAQLYTSTEQAMDMLAEKAGIDPMDFRILNAWKPGDVALCGERPTVYVVGGIMGKMKEKYTALKKHAAENSTENKKYGVGVAMGSFNISNFGDSSKVRIELTGDGKVTHYGTWEDMGQGADIGVLAYVHEGLRPLGIKPENIQLVMNDTGTCTDSGRAAASRSNLMVGLATRIACDKLLDAMRKEDGTYRTYDEMIAEGIPTSYEGYKLNRANPNTNDLTGEGKLTPDQSYAGFVTEVEVEVKTGKTRVAAMHCFSDAGTVTNWLSLEGQAFGGMMHSIGFALSEEYQDTPKCGNLIGCGFPYIDMIPDGDDFTLTNLETPREYSGYGGTGISEAYQSAGHASILNAIYQAVGVRVNSLPARPEKILQAMIDKACGVYKLDGPYYFGSDFNETLDDLKVNPPSASKDKEIAH